MLASTSPARRWLLESAGLSPEVIASGVDEGGFEDVPAVEAVAALAARKARAVAAKLHGRPCLVLGCDSLLEVDGQTWGKPASPAEVVRRWQIMRGRTGTLHTGHVLLDGATGGSTAETDAAVIRFGRPSDGEIAAYAATDEAMEVAGPFTLEGRSAPWIESIDGNYGTVTGVSLAVLRRLLGDLGVDIVDLWNRSQ